MGWRRDTAQGRAPVCGLGVGRTTNTLCLSLRMCVPGARGWAGARGYAAMAGEGILESDGLPGNRGSICQDIRKTSRVTTSASSQAQSTVQDKGLQGSPPRPAPCPSPLPELAPRQPHLCRPLSPTWHPR